MDYGKLKKEMQAWKDENIITQEQYLLLENRYNPKTKTVQIDKKRSIKSLVVFSIIIIILGVLSYIGQRVPAINDIVVPCSLIFFIIGTIFTGKILEERSLNVIKLLGKILIIIGCVLTSFVVFYIDIKSANKFGINLLGNDWSLFILISGLILWFVSYKLQNIVMLGYAMFSFVLWFVCQGKIYSGYYDGSWLGLTFPSRMLLFSLIILLLAYTHRSDFKGFGKIKLNILNDRFSRTYYSIGLFIMFVPVWIASLGGLIQKPLFNLKTEILLFILLSMTISIYLIYIGIIRNDKQTLNFGLAFMILEVYGKLYEFLLTRPSGTLFYAIVIIIAFGTAVIVEYILKNKDQLRVELLKGALKA